MEEKSNVLPGRKPLFNTSSTQWKIEQITSSLRKLLLYKNNKYGDAALSPLKIFSKLDAESSIAVRLDDKLSRVANAKELRKNDIADLLGYLTLLCASKDWLSFKEFED